MGKWPYDTPAWKKLRKAKLSHTPLCEYCPPGREVAAKHVDHRKAIKAGGDPWAWDNLVSCCPACHNRKTAKQDGAFGNPKRTGYGCDERGLPLDPDHWWRR